MYKLRTISLICLLTVAALFCGCNKDDGKDRVQLLETLTDKKDGYCKKFEYDGQNRLTTCSDYRPDGKLSDKLTLTYIENDLVKLVMERYDENGDHQPERNYTCEFTQSENTITVKETEGDDVGAMTLTLDSNGLPTKLDKGGSEVLYYQNQNGNLVSMSWMETSGEVSTFYKYDNKKSPSYCCETPKWCLFILNTGMSGNRNNIIEHISGNHKSEYEYEYDAAGFPAKWIEANNSQKYVVTEYTYKQF
jgi:hypothetical protein